MKRDSSSPEAYCKSVTGAQRELLDALRSVALEVAPEGETIGYGMLDYPGLANLGAQKNYVSLYVAPEVLARHLDRFPGVAAGKSCLRFARLEQFDAKAVRRLLREVRTHRSDQRSCS